MKGQYYCQDKDNKEDKGEDEVLEVEFATIKVILN